MQFLWKGNNPLYSWEARDRAKEKENGKERKVKRNKKNQGTHCVMNTYSAALMPFQRVDSCLT